MHQVLLLIVLLLENSIVSNLAEQGENQVKLPIIECILSCKHVVVSVVDDEISDTLLLILDC